MSLIVGTFPSAAQTGADLLARDYAGEWVSQRVMCAFDADDLGGGTTLVIAPPRISTINHGGENGRCEIDRVEQAGEGLRIEARCSAEESPPWPMAFDARLTAPDRLEWTGRAEDYLVERHLYRCTPAVRREMAEPQMRHCTIIDRSGAITDLETCSVRWETCGHSELICVILTWPSGAKTLVEAYGVTLATAAKINGRTVKQPSFDWLPAGSDCATNTGSGNTLCLTEGPFRRQ